MNNIISLKRIGLLLCNEFRMHGRYYLILAAVLVGVYILGGMFGGLNGLVGASTTFTSYISLITVLLPFIAYKNLFHSVKGVTATLLPASNEEKYLTAFLLCAVIFPLGLIVIGWVLSLLGALLTGHNEVIWNIGGLFVDNDRAYNAFSLGFFDSYFWQVIACQSFTLWAVHFFKTQKFWKAFLTWCCIGFVLLVIGSIAVLRVYQWNGGMQFNFSGETRFEHILYVFISIVVPIGFWVWGYLKMRKQQF